jgi:hypothetical protein
VNYKIWGVMQERVYTEKTRDVEELRHRIQQEWERLDQRSLTTQPGSGVRISVCVSQQAGKFREKKLQKR